jgi:hypothetical protein
MAAPANASLPPGFTLAPGYSIKITAMSPTTGAENTAVIVSDASVAVNQEELDTGGTQPPGQIFLVPGPAVGV